ncbi:phage portal protein [Phreatobacter sp.]|uniref:phage portal protein n=1 Tax=Phreatobacter sp. TaxID=1966341 RepID=UPI003F701D3F
MGLLDFLRRSFRSDASPRPRGESITFLDWDDPILQELLRGGFESASGMRVTVRTAMRNTALFRATTLIANAIGMLPLHLIDDETKQKASDHPLFRVLHREPNSFQSAFDFRALMQLRALVHGNAYALIIRSRDLRRGQEVVTALVPIDPERVTIHQGEDWSVTYAYAAPDGTVRELPASQIFHLRGATLDGLCGMSVVRQAAEAIGLALSAELAAARLFRHGTFVGGALTHPGKLSEQAFARLKASLAEKEGADNAGKNLILEEGMKFETFASNARDAQLTELRKLQVEEIARITGVPRPLLMVDETSWGSGIEALGHFFVQYALGPWFEAWQQAVERSLLTAADKDRYAVKFNAGALLRGSLKDQALFFSRALGAGGHPAWMSQNEVRDIVDMPSREGGDALNPGTGRGSPGPGEDGETHAPP